MAVLDVVGVGGTSLSCVGICCMRMGAAAAPAAAATASPAVLSPSSDYCPGGVCDRSTVVLLVVAVV